MGAVPTHRPAARAKKSVKVQFFCLCGATYFGRIPSSAVKKLEEILRQDHSGEGHGSTDAKTCARARTRAEQKQVQQRDCHQHRGG